MKFVGIVGSNAEISYNRKLLHFIKKHFAKQFELEILEIDNIPVQPGPQVGRELPAPPAVQQDYPS